MYERKARQVNLFEDETLFGGVRLDPGKRRYGLDVVMMRLKHTSEVDIHASILTRNLFKKVRALFRLIFGRSQRRILRSVLDRFALSGYLRA